MNNKASKQIKELIRALNQVPYLASRNIYRTVNYFLEMDEENLKRFCNVLIKTKKNLLKCPNCLSWKEIENPCSFCNNNRRDKNIICVVANWYNLYSIERTNNYRGMYHILGGVICPLEGIGPENLSIEALIKRLIINKNPVEEIILALSQTPEGEATSAYITKKIKESGAKTKISCLARGMPVGSSLENLDQLTINKAINERKILSN